MGRCAWLQMGRCACAGMGSDTHGVCACLWRCAARCAMQLGGEAGCGEGALGDHAATAAEHAFQGARATARPFLRWDQLPF